MRCVATLNDGTEIELPDFVAAFFDVNGFGVPGGMHEWDSIGLMLWHQDDDFPIRRFDDNGNFVDGAVFGISEGDNNHVYFKRRYNLPNTEKR